MQPTYQQESVEFDVKCELCSDWFDEDQVKYLHVWHLDELRISNNAEGVEVALCLTCYDKVA